MSEATTATAPARPVQGPVPISLVGALRFLATDRFGLLLLVWALVAFVARPVFLAAHNGAAGWPFEGIRAGQSLVSLAHIGSVLQWTSFTGLVALAIIGHTRYVAAAGGAGFAAPALRFRIAAAYTALLAFGYLVFLWSPVSVFTTITHDSFIFFDSTYRIANGLTPSKDFPTALGAASLYLPAWASMLGGGYGGSVEMASVWVALGLGLACACIGASRMPLPLTVTLVGVVFLVTVPGAMLDHWGGDSQTLIDGETEVLVDSLTYAMFYNRWGWAALIPLFIALIPRRDRTQATGLPEIVALALVLTFLFWLKLTYFAAGVAAAGVYAFTNPRPVRTLAWGTGLTAGLAVILGLLMGNLIAYLNDVLFAARVSGGRVESFLGLIRTNLNEMLFAIAPLGVLIAIGRFTWRDGMIGAFIPAICLFVINQNGQFENMPGLLVLAAYGAVRVMQEADSGRIAKIAACGAFAGLALVSILDRGLVLVDQAYAILREESRPPAKWASEPALRNVYIPERESLFDRQVNRSTTPAEKVETLWIFGQFGRRQELRQGEYMETLMAGLADLRAVMKPGETVNTLDMTNPFPFLMNGRVPKGSWLTLHKNRTISAELHPPPEQMFADSDHVMIAKMSMVQHTADLMREVYGPWLDANYADKVENLYWTRWSHRRTPLKPETQSAH